MSTVRHFKKYANRKFYDVDRGAYVGVTDIARVVRGGADIEMVCDRTGRVLTREILARILYEETRRAGRSPRDSRKPGPTAADIAGLVRLF